MTIDEMIAVLVAAKAGRKIELRHKGGMTWGVVHEPTWDFSGFDYRVAPEEPREFWVAQISLIAHRSEDAARESVKHFRDKRVVHVREVTGG